MLHDQEHCYLSRSLCLVLELKLRVSGKAIPLTGLSTISRVTGGVQQIEHIERKNSNKGVNGE